MICMVDELDVKTLENWFWKAACRIRGKTDAHRYKDYILPLIVLKRLSDSFEDEIAILAKEYDNKVNIEKLLETDHSLVQSYIPREARWGNITKQTTNVGEFLNRCFYIVAGENPDLDDLIDKVDFSVMSDEELRVLIDMLSMKRLGSSDVQSDILGRAYRHLLRRFAEGGGRRSGEFYTPREVAMLMSHILDPEKGDEICDPCCGSGGLLIECHLRLKGKYGDSPQVVSLKFYGQEILISTFVTAKMNMFIHGIKAKIKLGNTLASPEFVNADGSLKKFDLVAAYPPWGQGLSQDTYISDPYHRFIYGIPPSKSADWGWIQHMFASLKEDGKMVVLLDPGVVFRGSGSKRKSSEWNIRKIFVDQDWVEAVISLPPNLFYNTTAPGVILVINRDKKRENEILLINGSKFHVLRRPKNFLLEKDIQKVAEVYLEWREEKHLSKIIRKEEVAEKDYNLNPLHYVILPDKHRRFEYDVAISFAGEDREIAEELANRLHREGVRVFYDDFYKHDLWGKELPEYFQEVYGPKTKFAILLVSQHYSIKDWTDFEFSVMMEEAKKRETEFILPVRLDDTKIVGLHGTVGYLDYRIVGIGGIVECMLRKLSSISNQHN